LINVFRLMVIVLAGLLTGLVPPEVQADSDKIDPWLLEKSLDGEAIEYLVVLSAQADFDAIRDMSSRLGKLRAAQELMRETASATQKPLIKFLVDQDAEYGSFWIANALWVRSDADLMMELAQRKDVRSIGANRETPIQIPAVTKDSATKTVEWNIALIGATDVWALGITGEGAVIAGQDTGYDWDHPALKNSYRGWNGASANHNYNWHDSIHDNNGQCNGDSVFPCDDTNHGTHTMGTMVGDDGGANQIGVAPGARWIGCRNMNSGAGTPATYMECFEWFLAPTDLNDQNPDSSKAPHVINNSWGCPDFEGCTSDALLLTVQNTRAAGIVVVVSAGNSGSLCNTVVDPPAIYAESFSVGATTSADVIAGFSSRGPVTRDGSNRLKPDISAPGVGVRSSVPSVGYATFQGTSMAGPHVAGLVALLISAEPTLAGNPDAIEAIIRDTAVPLTTTQDCGGVSGSDVPNNTFGFGRIDALAAVTVANQTVFRNGFETP